MLLGSFRKYYLIIEFRKKLKCKNGLGYETLRHRNFNKCFDGRVETTASLIQTTDRCARDFVKALSFILPIIRKEIIEDRF